MPLLEREKGSAKLNIWSWFMQNTPALDWMNDISPTHYTGLTVSGKSIMYTRGRVNVTA